MRTEIKMPPLQKLGLINAKIIMSQKHISNYYFYLVIASNIGTYYYEFFHRDFTIVVFITNYGSIL